MKLYSVQLLTFAILVVYGWLSPSACTCVSDRSSSVQGSSAADTTHFRPEEIAGQYVSALNLTSWSAELGPWITEHRYTGAVDTFHEVESFQWPYEQYCFKTRTESGGCKTEYSFFDNGDHVKPGAILQQAVIV